MNQNLNNAQSPRQAYPRPQFTRSHWLNLNGVWEFAFDDANIGLGEGWGDGRTLPQSIMVPFAYQCELSGINDKTIHETVWYARNFEVPAEWAGQEVMLNFGAVDYRSTVWINGHEVGHNQGGHVPFSFNITPYLQQGANRLTLRVVDSQDSSQPRGKQSSTGLSEHINYYCTTGIWQTVWLEPVPSMRIQELSITPNVEDESLELRLFLHAPNIGWHIQAEVLEQGVVVGRVEKVNAGSAPRLMVNVPNVKPWSPSSPHLYDIRLRLLRDGVVIDEVGSYSGFRSIDLRDKQFLLNGKPTYLAMVLDQGYWPGGGTTAPTDEALRADVEWTKRLGFNGARKHQKIEDPLYYYWCDKLGVLVWAEMANAKTWSAESEEWMVSEWERAVRRDANHPCIVTWVPLNESMGVPEVSRHPGQYSFTERLVALTRRLDPHRPVIDNDGWEHTDVTDIFAVHDYTPTSAKLRERYAATIAGGELPAISGGETVTGEKWGLPLLAGKAGYHGQPVVLSEVAGLMMMPSDIPDARRDGLYEVYGVCETPEDFLAKYRDIMEGVAQLSFVCGFCTTQLTDIEQEMNGLLSYHRQPKIEPELVARIHRELFGVG